jgi:hypothetical protein
MSTPEDRDPEQEEPPRGALLFIAVAYGPTLARLVATSRLNAPGFRVW